MRPQLKIIGEIILADNVNGNVSVVIENTEEIENLIHYVRGQQIMVDSDLAKLYNVETKRLNESVNHRFVIHFLYLQCSHLLSLNMQNSHPASRMAML